MGNWKLEVFKLAMYITFPVTIFYIFNQPQLFEDWVVKRRQELYARSDVEGKKRLQEYIAKVRREQIEKQLLEKLSKVE